MRKGMHGSGPTLTWTSKEDKRLLLEAAKRMLMIAAEQQTPALGYYQRVVALLENN
jgi:hypothetical protein